MNTEAHASNYLWVGDNSHIEAQPVESSVHGPGVIMRVTGGNADGRMHFQTLDQARRAVGEIATAIQSAERKSLEEV